MKKFVTLITVMVLLFSFAATAMAEEVVTTPVEESSLQELAGQKLVEAGIVGGYADGSLGLENTITRAEIASLIVKSSGLTAEADALKGSESKFSDVKASDWFAGLVNLSAEKGWITGDPAGTFRPNDPVQYREAITMILRALGYTNENLGGQWPANYIDKAVELGLPSDLELNLTDVAPRGDVFVVLAATIDFETVKFSEKLIFTVDENTAEETVEEVKEEETDTELAIIISVESIDKKQVKIVFEKPLTEDQAANKLGLSIQGSMGWDVRYDDVRFEAGKSEFIMDTNEIERGGLYTLVYGEQSVDFEVAE